MQVYSLNINYVNFNNLIRNRSVVNFEYNFHRSKMSRNENPESVEDK